MNKVFFFLVFLLPLMGAGQDLDALVSIDSMAFQIDIDASVTKKVYDTVRYEKEDGGSRWDSVYSHREYYYRDGQVVKIVAWNKYGDWRNDMVGYYNNGKVVKFAKGESFRGKPDYGQLNFAIYYNQDKELTVSWLTPRPDNVVSVATDVFLHWAYDLRNGAR